MFKKIVLAVCLALISCLPAAPVSALEAGDVVVRVNPAEQKITLEPGTILTGGVKVQNIGRKAFTFRPLTAPYWVKGDDYLPDFATETAYTKMHNWISFEQEEYHLEPGTEVEVPFRVRVPQDIPGGGQYAAIIFETRDSVDEQQSFQAVNRVASLLYAKVKGETRESGQITSQSLPSFFLGKPISADITIHNDGNLDFPVTHTLSVNDFFTGRSLLDPMNDDPHEERPGYSYAVILPDTSRLNTLTWDGSPRFGLFRVRETASFLDREEVFERVVFVCPIWLLALVIFFIVLAVIWIILRIVSRKKKRHVKYTV